MTALLIGWWDQLTPSQRGRRHVLLLAIAVHLFAFLLYSWWYVEDAAISFSYAHNLASGEGLVTVPGGERVEGFSNPTWTLLLALLDLLGISPWIAAKLLGAGLSVGALWLGLRWAETLMGEDAGPWPALAPVALAVSPQLVVWSASGLENPLFTVLLAGGSVALLREAERRGAGIPWSGLLFFLLAVTRPEGAMYGAVAGLVGLAAVGHRGGLRAALSWGLRWGALLAVPLVAWHTWRYAYFAWEFPNTYYAKLWEQKLFAPLDWDGKGWLYLRGYGLVSTVAFLLPVYALGQTGAAGKRRWIALALVGLTFVLMAPTLRFPAELPFYARPDLGDVYPQVVAGVLLALLALLPLAGIGRRGAVARALAWWMCGAAVFFALYSGGDWMKGHRWLSYCVVPMAVLLADGAYALHQALPVGRVQRWAPRAVIATALIASVVHLGLRLGMPETSPYDVKRRVMHMVDVQERLHLDRVSLLEVDMGAHMWWSGFGLVDMAGLVDVPMARSRYDKPYIRTYVYEERDPEFAHVHGGWATRTKLKTHREWSRYLSIPPYPISPWQTHPGAYIRKDLLIRKRWEGERGRRVVFGEDVELTGWQTPAPEAVGQALEHPVDRRAFDPLHAHDRPVAELHQPLHADDVRVAQALEHPRFVPGALEHVGVGGVGLLQHLDGDDRSGGVGQIAGEADGAKGARPEDLEDLEASAHRCLPQERVLAGAGRQGSGSRPRKLVTCTSVQALQPGSGGPTWIVATPAARPACRSNR